MTPVEWAFRPLRKYAVFSGRASRAEYWWFYLLTIVAGLVGGLLDRLVGGQVVSWILNLFLLVPWIAVSVRRLHDIDRTGWWLLILFLSVLLGGIAMGLGVALGGGMFTGIGAIAVAVVALLVGIVTLLVFMVTEGTRGSNSYGPDPYAAGDLEEVFA
jgi:uncharacterized membrane protein YhaH (DUF805 family)